MTINTILTIAKIQIIRAIKNPGLIIIWSAIPFVLAGLFYIVFNPGSGSSDEGLPKIMVMIIDHDKTFVSQGLYQVFQREPLIKYFKAEYLEDETKLPKMFEKHLASAAIEIPKGFQEKVLKGRQTALTLIKNPGQYYAPLITQESLLIVLNLANRVIGGASEGLNRIDEMMQNNRQLTAEDVSEISVSFFHAGERIMKMNNLNNVQAKLVVEKKEQAPKATAGGSSQVFFSIIFPGLVFFSILFIGMELQHQQFRDFQAGITKRISISPVSVDTLMWGNILFSAIVLICLTALSILIGVLVLGMRIQNIFTLILVVSGFCLFVIGLGKTVFGQSKSEGGASAIGPAVIVILCLIGGSFIPLDEMPTDVQVLARLTPVGLANTGIVDSLLYGSPLSKTGLNIAGVWCWAVVLLAAGYILERRKLSGS